MLPAQDLATFIQEQPEGSAGIVYARQRDSCDWLARKLMEGNISAGVIFKMLQLVPQDSIFFFSVNDLRGFLLLSKRATMLGRT